MTLEILTGALVIVTAFYAVATWNMVRIMAHQDASLNRQRKASIRPAVLFGGDTEGPGESPRACLFNVGNGIALNVRAWCRNYAGAYGKPQEAASLGAKEAHQLEDWYNHFWEPTYVWILYEDAEGNAYYSCGTLGKWDIGEGAGPEIPRDALLEQPDLRGGTESRTWVHGDDILVRRDAKVERLLTSTEQDLLIAAVEIDGPLWLDRDFEGGDIAVVTYAPEKKTQDTTGQGINMLDTRDRYERALQVEALHGLVDNGCIQPPVGDCYILTGRGHRIGYRLRDEVKRIQGH